MKDDFMYNFSISFILSLVLFIVSAPSATAQHARISVRKQVTGSGQVNLFQDFICDGTFDGVDCSEGCCELQPPLNREGIPIKVLNFSGPGNIRHEGPTANDNHASVTITAPDTEGEPEPYWVTFTIDYVPDQFAAIKHTDIDWHEEDPILPQGMEFAVHAATISSINRVDAMKILTYEVETNMEPALFDSFQLRQYPNCNSSEFTVIAESQLSGDEVSFEADAFPNGESCFMVFGKLRYQTLTYNTTSPIRPEEPFLRFTLRPTGITGDGLVGEGETVSVTRRFRHYYVLRTMGNWKYVELISPSTAEKLYVDTDPELCGNPSQTATIRKTSQYSQDLQYQVYFINLRSKSEGYLMMDQLSFGLFKMGVCGQDGLVVNLRAKTVFEAYDFNEDQGHFEFAQFNTINENFDRHDDDYAGFVELLVSGLSLDELGAKVSHPLRQHYGEEQVKLEYYHGLWGVIHVFTPDSIDIVRTHAEKPGAMLKNRRGIYLFYGSEPSYMDKLKTLLDDFYQGK